MTHSTRSLLVKFKSAILLGVVTILAALGFWLFRLEPFAVLDAGGGYSFHFYLQPARFINEIGDLPSDYRKLEYELVRDGRTVFRELFTWTPASPADFELQLVISNTNRVVAIVERSAPDIVFLVYDLDSGESSRQEDAETHTSALKRANRLLARLQPSVQQTLIMRAQANLGPGRVIKL